MALRILVTGSSGFIGKSLTPALAMQGHFVRAAARQAGLELDARIEQIRLPDITHPVDWAPLVQGMDVVVHLAGIAHRQGGKNVNYDQANRGAVADLAAACRASGVGKLIFMSSIGAVTGSAADHIVTEADTPRPVTAYDHAKLAAEEAVRASGVPYTILRPVIVYGPEPKANVALLARLAKLPLPLPLAAFHNRRSLLALDNLISAVIHCLDDKRTRNETYVVSDQEALTLAEMLTVMRREMKRSPNLVSVPPIMLKAALFAINHRSLWNRIGRDLVVNPRAIIAAGWRPVIATDQGLRAMINSLEKHPSENYKLTGGNAQ